jgi:hypothetical protein
VPEVRRAICIIDCRGDKEPLRHERGALNAEAGTRKAEIR